MPSRAGRRHHRQRAGAKGEAPIKPRQGAASRISQHQAAARINLLSPWRPLRGWRWSTRLAVSGRRSLVLTWPMPWRPEVVAEGCWKAEAPAGYVH